jgi:hypothetical protein
MGLWKPRRFGAVLAAQSKVYALPINANVSGVVVSNARELLGWWITSSVAAAGHFRIWDGSVVTGPKAGLVCGGGQFVAGGDSLGFLADQGYALTGGGSIYLQFVTAGSYEGCIYWA